MNNLKVLSILNPENSINLSFHHMQCIVRWRFLNIFQLCDPCSKAVKLQKVEIEEEQAPLPDTDTSSTTPTPPTKDFFLLLWEAFIMLVLAILIGVIFHIITKENFLSNVFSTNSTKN